MNGAPNLDAFFFFFFVENVIPTKIVKKRVFLLRSVYSFPSSPLPFFFLILRTSKLENSNNLFLRSPIPSRKNRHKRAIAYSAYKFLAREVFPFPLFLLLF